MLAENGASLNRRNGNGVLNGIWGALPAMWGRFCAQWAAIPYQWAQIAAARAVSPLLKMLKNRCHAVLWLSPYRCKVWKLCAVEWLKPSQRHTPQRSTSTTKEANGLNILRLKAVAPRETLCYMRHDFAASRSCEA